MVPGGGIEFGQEMTYFLGDTVEISPAYMVKNIEMWGKVIPRKSLWRLLAGHFSPSHCLVF